MRVGGRAEHAAERPRSASSRGPRGGGPLDLVESGFSANQHHPPARRGLRPARAQDLQGPRHPVPVTTPSSRAIFGLTTDDGIAGARHEEVMKSFGYSHLPKILKPGTERVRQDARSASRGACGQRPTTTTSSEARSGAYDLHAPKAGLTGGRGRRGRRHLRSPGRRARHRRTRPASGRCSGRPRSRQAGCRRRMHPGSAAGPRPGGR